MLTWKIFFRPKPNSKEGTYIIADPTQSVVLAEFVEFKTALKEMESLRNGQLHKTQDEIARALAGVSCLRDLLH